MTTMDVFGLSQGIGTIEEAYEFLLAYAAQGALDDRGTPDLRAFLRRLAAAIDGIGGAAAEVAETLPSSSQEAWRAFAGVLAADRDKAGKAVALVLACPRISSQLIDNLNANIHLRALLTDLFLLDEAAKAHKRQLNDQMPSA